MKDGCTLKDFLHGKHFIGARTIGRPYLSYKDTCECDMKITGIDINNLETAVCDSGNWRSIVKSGMKSGEFTVDG